MRDSYARVIRMIIWLGEVFKDAREYTHWYGVHDESRVVEVVVHPYAWPYSVRPLIVFGHL